MSGYPEPFEWFVLNYNMNKKTIEPFNVLRNSEKIIKNLKKKSDNFGEFAKQLNSEMMYHFWSRAEYELLLRKTDQGLFLCPWVVSSSNDLVIPVPVDSDFDWYVFANQMFSKYISRDNYVKFDIYDQLKFRWNDFVHYCWTFHHKYERKREG